MKKLILRNFYVILVGSFSLLSGIIIGALWLFYQYPGFNLMISYHNNLSTLTLNTILVVLGIFTIAASLYYYRESTKEDKNSNVGPSTIEQHTKGGIKI
jgi:membrane-bound ClpP family serine protease